MTLKFTEIIKYYDFKLSLPFFLSKDETTKIKIPATCVNDALSKLEKDFDISVDSIQEIHVYEISKISGNTRVDYRKVQHISGTFLNTSRAIYKRKK